jgi:glycyl-tRNA synthetase beta chain
MSNKFLFELGTEEIPADMISGALQQLFRKLTSLLEENQVGWTAHHLYDSPRRLGVFLEGLPDRQPDRQEVILGPPRSIALDGNGNAMPAAEGFARKQGVSLSEVEITETPRGAYLCYRKTIPGQATVRILGEGLPRVISSISWPKTMYWRETRFRFIRPLRWFLALWNDEVLPFEFEGVRSSNITRGHRFLGSRDVVVPSAEQYVDRLRDNFVMVRLEERISAIRQGLNQAIPEGLRVRPDEELFHTISYLNEYPGVVCGRFEERFLRIPKEVLQTVMRHHQKYFSVENEASELQPYFLAVLNTTADPDGRIRAGHERVLKARLEDAAFFWDTDRRTPLADRLGLIEHVLFQEKLGTYRDKTERIRRICRHLGGDDDLDRAALLCKVDLTTDMVRELTELQGVMGGLYARHEGHPESVWKAIYEHYQPVALEDDPPATPNGALLSLADRLDTIVGCFGIGVIPSGSSDPLGLRRQAQGLIKILLNNPELEFSLDDLITAAGRNFQNAKSEEQTRGEVKDFLSSRVRFILQEKGFSYDVLNAVLGVGIGNVRAAHAKVEALSAMRGESDFEALAIAYKRIKNILSGQPTPQGEVRPEDFDHPSESTLYQAFSEVKEQVGQDLGQKAYLEALRKIARLRAPVDRYFDDVMVMVDNEEVRRNRLRTLFEISRLFLSIADISEIVQKEQVNERVNR